MKNNVPSIIIPSFNESKSLKILLQKVNRLYPEALIYLVDDSSYEENRIIKSIVNKYKQVGLISRIKKLGRGSAVLDGFKIAFRKNNSDLFLEMDSDLAHDPNEIKRFLEKDELGNYDLIIGSRYLPGGKIKNIEKQRTILSRLINVFLRFWLGIKVTDFTSGFRAYSRKAVAELLRSDIESKGFITLSESLYKLHIKGFSIGEVPITWNYRKFGKSNVSIKELFYSLFFVIKMKIMHELPIFYKNKFFLCLVIFLLALSVRISTLNQMGRTWDEPEYIEQGYKMIELLKVGDFGNSFFYTTYDHPPLVKYLYGLTAHLDVDKLDSSGNPVFNYNYTYSRIFSSIVGSLSAVLVFIFTLELASVFVAFSAAIIFLLLPFFVGLSQQVTTESFLMFFFTLGVYVFYRLLRSFSYKKAVLVGIITGLALLTKQSNGLLFPLYGLFYLTYYLYNKTNIKLFNRKIIYSFFIIIFVSILTFVVFWPMPYTHLDYIAEVNKKIWLVNTAPPEVFWGKLILSPVIYFPTMFFITTPLLLIILFLLGLKFIDKNRSWINISLIIWFIFPFIQSFYPWRMHGVRYIIEIYVPLSIIAGMGAYAITIFLKNKFKFIKTSFSKIIILLIVLAYLLIIVKNNAPYFLNYYNELVGGQKGVYEKKYFHLGWWGDGMREAAIYLEQNAPKESNVGLAVNPPKSFPNIKNLNLELYKDGKKYDYIVVNYYHVLREGFDDSSIKRDYKLVHQIISGGAPIVSIYKTSK
ncbi:MAG: hypothetical protein A3B38_01750 [Candidatus Levybacteria bacterium RIFCSPLOWO2_01_FULL_36_13]|nr:MAG: hypothetical protein A2684_02985 [Candidatus Levybacteria bacterium RIFCSPHIGHO2_01_FULL_36_15b]OGH35588.1 MAG: hypothetical protein A3B38_01750 [Candidatus Levybacteria bacterium RIFCSPLOWO2_01_FULL_36_13]